MRFLSALLFVMLAFAASEPAFAQSNDDMEKAKGHFAKGAEFYASGDYSKAIVEFINGHNIAPNAMFLYNISLSYERLDNVDDALGAAQKARGFDGMTDEIATRNEARIASFKTVLDARETAEDIDQNVVVDTPAEDPESSFGAVGWTGVVFSVVGAGAVGYALYLNQQVVDGKDELASATTYAEGLEISDEMNSNRALGRVVLLTGIGVGTVGLALIVWDLLDGSSETEVGLAPVVTDSEAGFVIQGQF